MASRSVVAAVLLLVLAMSLRVDGRPDFCGTGPKYGAWPRIGVVTALGVPCAAAQSRVRRREGAGRGRVVGGAQLSRPP